MAKLGDQPRDQAVQAASANAKTLVTTPEKMADELAAGGKALSMSTTSTGLAEIPLVVLSSDDGLVPGTDALVRAVSHAGRNGTTKHEATDHSSFDRRIKFAELVIDWLYSLPRREIAIAKGTLVLPGRIELPTSALPRMRSTTELRQRSARSGGVRITETPPIGKRRCY